MLAAWPLAGNGAYTMEMRDVVKDLSARLHALAVFRHLLDDEVLGRLLAVLDSADVPAMRRVDAYCGFVAALYERGGDLGNCLLRLVLETENAVVHRHAAGAAVPPEMEACLQKELALFSALSRLQARELAAWAGSVDEMPLWANSSHDFAAAYRQRLAEIGQKGYGIFAEYHMFTLGEDGTLLPVRNPDPQQLDELAGYERERRQVLLNTRALLEGLPANNILLYGDAGTGKSSTVKAVGNAFAPDGLRLIEIRKNQLYQIPRLMDTLADNPLKFIFFIDDLSFPADDGDFTALKAILEGNISARPGNIVVYATSNRRHMVAERFSDREGSDVHASETVEEATSLSARFGLTITFLRPDRELYMDIVGHLAEEYGLVTPRQMLLQQAERHAIRYGGRSPRTARQFVEMVKAEESLRAKGW